MDDLGSLAEEITRFAAEHDMTVIPVIPGTDSGPAVLLDPHDLDLTAFLGLARRLGDGALYVRAETVGTDPETGEPDGDLPGELARRKGRTCDIAVAFASGHGVIHVWSDTAPWWREWLDSQETVDTGDTGGQARQEERERAERELADVILADSEYRASGPSARRRRGQLLIPAGTDHYTGFGAADLARRRGGAFRRGVPARQRAAREPGGRVPGQPRVAGGRLGRRAQEGCRVVPELPRRRVVSPVVHPR